MKDIYSSITLPMHIGTGNGSVQYTTVDIPDKTMFVCGIESS